MRARISPYHHQQPIKTRILLGIGIHSVLILHKKSWFSIENCWQVSRGPDSHLALLPLMKIMIFSVLSTFVMRDLRLLLTQYELLQHMAQYLSARDLFNTALACQDLYSCILMSLSVFRRLKRLTICDGSGLRKRQDFTGLYKPYSGPLKMLSGAPYYDEEIEVQVYNIKCDATNALPCLKCEVNVCEVGLTAYVIIIPFWRYYSNLYSLRNADMCPEWETRNTTNHVAGPI